jgi:hypothetical protein
MASGQRDPVELSDASSVLLVVVVGASEEDEASDDDDDDDAVLGSPPPELELGSDVEVSVSPPVVPGGSPKQPPSPRENTIEPSRRTPTRVGRGPGPRI